MWHNVLCWMVPRLRGDDNIKLQKNCHVQSHLKQTRVIMQLFNKSCGMFNVNTSNLVNDIDSLHRECIINWKKNGMKLQQNDFLKLVEENHAFNYQLWHAEDRARRDDLGHEMVYLAKREIDHCNQQRNNRMESMDEWLFTTLKPASHTHCVVHSETPGMMIDRLSIMALKNWHMAQQTVREDADQEHRQRCLHKLHVIREQQQQLMFGLKQLLHEIVEGTRTFRMYHQFKMYNDVSLNPELYQHQKAVAMQSEYNPVACSSEQPL
jgi:hypothetical protein